jgi:hypothetical protein
MDPDQQTDDHSSHDAASHGGDTDQPTDAPAVATAVDPDQHPSSCPPLSQPVSTSQEPLERSNHRLAVVEKNSGTGGLLLRLLTELDDDALSLLRREMYIDGVNGDLYPMLDNFLHVVALDSDGPLAPEP